MTTSGSGRVPRPRGPAVEPYFPLQISIRPGDDCDVVALAGEIDIASAPQVRSALQRLLAEGRQEIVVDLDEVSFLDASALSALIEATEAVSELGGRLHVTPHPRLMQLLTVTGEAHRVNVTVSSRSQV